MAIQSIPLANSLYLAMLSQERQDSERRNLKHQEDLTRRDKNMRDTQDYILRTQDQKQKHERDKQDMALKQRAQLMQERIEQAGMMERRQQQDQAAMQRTLVGERGKNIDRRQRHDASLATQDYRDRSLAERATGRQQKQTFQNAFKAESINLANSKAIIEQKTREMDQTNDQIKAAKGTQQRTERIRLKGVYKNQAAALQSLKDIFNAKAHAFAIQNNLNTGAPAPLGGGLGRLGDDGGGGNDVSVQDVMDGMGNGN